MAYSVFVSGGTGSIGAAIVHRFCGRGDDVTFQYTQNADRAEALSKQLGARAIKVDFRQQFFPPDGPFDILINNAAINVTDACVERVVDDDWEATLRVNLYAPFALMKAYLPEMRRRGWGRIVNVGSIYSLRGVEGNLPYTVSKHALSGLTKTTAKEYACHGITCNEICPGPVESELMQRIAVRTQRSATGTPEDYLMEVASEIPAGRMAKPEEVAELVAFLASAGGAYVNGASVTLDGGLTA